MDHLSRLESRSIFILREAYYAFEQLCMLWSIGKDSTVLLWLARKAFLGTVPFPLAHIDTTFKIPEMIEYRDRIARELRLDICYGINEDAIRCKETFPDGAVGRATCCKLLKTKPLADLVAGRGVLYWLNHDTGFYEARPHTIGFTGVIVGLRADEEGSRSKERFFSIRDAENAWHVEAQAPELWNQFNTGCPPGAHVRVHPLLEWTESDVWEYIARENIPTVSLYYDQGSGTRYRSLGCANCTCPIRSTSSTPRDIVQELRTGKLATVSERSGRAQDEQGGAGLETLRKDGYM